MGVVNGELRQAYARFHLGEDKYRMYHGTTLTSALDICEGSFRVGTGGSSGGESTLMLGPGVYASPDRKKAETYAKMRKGEPGAILELEVDMGKKICKVTSQEQHNRMTWQLEGYDSAWVPEGCGMVRREMTEVCVKNPNQIKVSAVVSIHYNCTSRESYALRKDIIAGLLKQEPKRRASLSLHRFCSIIFGKKF